MISISNKYEMLEKEYIDSSELKYSTLNRVSDMIEKLYKDNFINKNITKLSNTIDDMGYDTILLSSHYTYDHRPTLEVMISYNESHSKYIVSLVIFDIKKVISINITDISNHLYIVKRIINQQNDGNVINQIRRATYLVNQPKGDYDWDW